MTGRSQCEHKQICSIHSPKMHIFFSNSKSYYIYTTSTIHVIFSKSQIGRFDISQREIGVSDREIFAR